MTVKQIKIESLRTDIERAIRELGKDRGELQNDMDIEAWHKAGYINEQESTELKRYNRKLCR